MKLPAATKLVAVAWQQHSIYRPLDALFVFDVIRHDETLKSGKTSDNNDRIAQLRPTKILHLHTARALTGRANSRSSIELLTRVSPRKSARRSFARSEQQNIYQFSQFGAELAVGLPFLKKRPPKPFKVDCFRRKLKQTFAARESTVVQLT